MADDSTEHRFFGCADRFLSHPKSASTNTESIHSILLDMRPDFPFRPSAFPFYYGWIVLAASTVGMVMSAPGQTIGVSVFTESLLEVTGLSRVEFSNAYLMGTLASGLMLPYAGFGDRPVRRAPRCRMGLARAWWRSWPI